MNVATRWFLPLLAGFALLSLDGAAEDRAPAPVDADRVIAACWSPSKAERESGSALTARQGMVAVVACLRAEFLDHYRTLIQRYVDFARFEDRGLVKFVRRFDKFVEPRNQHATLESIDPAVVDERNRREYETRARDGSCYPSCSPIEISDDLDRDARVGELLVRDLIAERILYAPSPEKYRGLALAHLRDADRLIRDCWTISAGMRSGSPEMLAWGLERTVRCLEYVVMDQTETFNEGGEPFLRLETRTLLHKIGWLGDVLFVPMHRSNPICGTRDCGPSVASAHLRDRAELVAEVIRIVVALRLRLGF